MTDQKEGFVHRWARRAHQARHEQTAEAPPPAEVAEPEPKFDPEDQPELPPIETLDATSDYTAFLGADVPKVVRAAALRKAWTSDPVIAAHRPLVEYDWDCNAPGYGRLKPNDQTGKLARNLLRHFHPKEETAEEPAPEAEIAAAAAPPAPASSEDRPQPIPQAAAVEEDAQDTASADAPAPEDEAPEEQMARARPRHGGARPA